MQGQKEIPRDEVANAARKGKLIGILEKFKKSENLTFFVNHRKEKSAT